MRSIPAKHRALLTCMVVWLVSFLAVDAVHAFAHDICADPPNQPHPCLACQLHTQPFQVQEHVKPAVAVRLVYAEAKFAQPATVQLASQSSPQPLIPRGPPA